MQIRKISFGLIGGLMMSGAFMSCSDDSYVNKAKEEAVEYLSGDELLRAERFAREQRISDKYSAQAVAYWDSLLIEAKSKEAYLKGQQVIKDSVAGNFFRKEKYRPQLDTIIAQNLFDNLKKEYAKYSTAKEFIKARDNAPSETRTYYYSESPYQTHYWNLITSTGKQKTAYQKGMNDARKELKLK